MAVHFRLSKSAQEIESRIRANRLLNLPVPWEDEMIYPHFGGFSILNVMQSVLSQFGVSSSVHPIDASVWGEDEIPSAVERVVIFHTDGLGYKLLCQLVDEDAELTNIIQDMTDGRGFVPLTSTAPSTTAVALPSLWTANYPVTHGMLGTVMYMPEFTMLGDMLAHKPASGIHVSGAFGVWGVEAENFIPVKTVAEQLVEVSAPTHLLLNQSLIGTGLSRIMHRGIRDEHRHVHVGTHDVWQRLQDVLQATRGQRCYVNVYLPVVDTLSHMYGARSVYVRNEVLYQMRELRNVLVSDVVKDGQTLVLVFADHGHYDAPYEINLATNEKARVIRESIRGSFGGDLRFAQLYLRSGTRQRVIDVLAQAFAHDLAWVEPETAVHSGLLGTGEAHPLLMPRLGDLIVVPRLGVRLSDASQGGHSGSIHGGLSDWEMLVPFMWAYL